MFLVYTDIPNFIYMFSNQKCSKTKNYSIPQNIDLSHSLKFLFEVGYDNSTYVSLKPRGPVNRRFAIEKTQRFREPRFSFWQTHGHGVPEGQSGLRKITGRETKRSGCWDGLGCQPLVTQRGPWVICRICSLNGTYQKFINTFEYLHVVGSYPSLQ